MEPLERASQPGLEVRNTYDTDPVVVHSQAGHWTAPPHGGSGDSSAATSEPSGAFERSNTAPNAAGPDHDSYGEQQPGRSRRFPWLLFGIGSLAVLVLGRVNPTENLPGAVGDPPPSTSATKIMQNSALAAVGWLFGPDITLQAFFQSPNASMRRSQYMSLFQNWTAPMEAGAAPKANSPFGASQLWTKPDQALPQIPQTEVFYIGSPPYNILCVNWREGFSRGGLPDSVNEGRYTLSNTGTQMAANGDVMEVFFDYKAPKFQEPTAVGITASPGSALVILPREVIHSAGDGTSTSSARIVYRGTDGQLGNYDRSSSGQKVTSSSQLPVTVDSNFTMAGFAVARLDSGSKISYVYEDDTTGWKGPETDPVFDGADNPTHIAYVTASSAKVKRQPKHVHFDGNQWSDMGFLPIP
ncbi:hypothetical protein LX36DRAFT_734272 [Colletotrichum falcatum]|nr:hypothetical protein LX36DRAFT_734272 [Colletotrichum falcatum]